MRATLIIRPGIVKIAVLAVCCFAGRPAEAQVAFEVVGARALGMGGAFTAVADDPNATFWNPAGLLKGPVAGLTIAGDRFHFRDPNGPPVVGASRLNSQSVAFGAWPVGVSFLRVSTAGVVRDQAGVEGVYSLSTTQLGFTVLQSLGDFVVVGATAKYIRGSAGFSAPAAATAAEALDAALDAASDSRGAFDLDLGIVAGTDRVRAAAAFKNLQRPGFKTLGGKAIYLERRVRFGLSASPRDGLTLAIDVDLDTADPLVGLRRTVAVGGDAQLSAKVFLRAGMRWDRREVKRPIGAFGGSISVRRGLWLDGYVTRGRSRSQGFGLALRAAM
ncbi:MAG TPA: conjugal transfer protein TraF [Vicinamibacterales bacterium]|nr:conjugal transfer protein TraF [Vicinamibacterales bacterium]